MSSIECDLGGPSSGKFRFFRFMVKSTAPRSFSIHAERLAIFVLLVKAVDYPHVLFLY